MICTSGIHPCGRIILRHRCHNDIFRPASAKSATYHNREYPQDFRSCSYGILSYIVYLSLLSGGMVYRKKRRSPSCFVPAFRKQLSCILHMISAYSHLLHGNQSICCGDGYIHSINCNSYHRVLSSQLSYLTCFVLICISS